jgi:WD40 repeat protein
MLLLQGHAEGEAVRSLAFTPDGQVLASCTLRELYLWDLLSGTGRRLTPSHGAGASFYSVAYSPDQVTLAVGFSKPSITGHMSGALLVREGEWDGVLEGGGLWEAGLRVAYAPAKPLLGVVGDRIDVWRLPRPGVADHCRRVRADHFGATACLAFAPDGRALAVGHSIRRNALGPAEHVVKLWHVRTGFELAAFRGHAGSVSALAFAPDGRTLAAACGPSVWRWDVKSREGSPLDAPCQSDVADLAFAPDGRYLAAGHGGGTVRCWDARTWREGPAFDWGVGPVSAVAFARDGMRAAAGSRKGKLVVWDVDL